MHISLADMLMIAQYVLVRGCMFWRLCRLTKLTTCQAQAIARQHCLMIRPKPYNLTHVSVHISSLNGIEPVSFVAEGACKLLKRRAPFCCRYVRLYQVHVAAAATAAVAAAVTVLCIKAWLGPLSNFRAGTLHLLSKVLGIYKRDLRAAGCLDQWQVDVHIGFGPDATLLACTDPETYT